MRTACRAPSLHNSQPWQWVFNRGQLRLFLDPSRGMDTDQSAREALISCGAALDHLRVAMAAAGWQVANSTGFPTRTARIIWRRSNSPRWNFVTDRDRKRASAISGTPHRPAAVRRTDRLAVLRTRGGQQRSTGKPYILEVIADDLHPRLEEAAQIAESLRSYDTPYHNELHWWTAPFEASEGIPYSALVSAAEGDRVGIGPSFSRSAVGPNDALEIPEDHAKVLLLSTDDDTRTNALASGEALSATLLECTMAGLATSPVTHLTEVAVTRELIKSLMDHDAVPQVLVRVGVVPVTEKAPRTTPRRPLSEVLRLKG